MDIIEAIILGIIQGLTEWLPISSSGHLAIAQHYIGPPPLIFDIMVHFGTMLVLLVYFRKDASAVRRGVFAALRDMRKGKGFREAVYPYPHRRMAWFIVIGIVPTAAIGLFLNFTVIEELYGSMVIVGTCLILTGLVLILTMKVRGRRRIMGMGPKDAWLIGVAQGLAIIPGISRSGSTIGIGLLRGIDAETAGRYSFLLAIPSILGAVVLRVPDFFSGEYEIDLVAFLVGTCVAMVVGYICLALLMRVLKGKGFYAFAFYCWVAGGFVIGAWCLGI